MMRNAVKPRSLATEPSCPSVDANPPSVRSAGSSDSRNSRVRARQTAPTAESTQNVARQSASWSTAVPMLGAAAGPMTKSTCMMDKIFSRRSARNESFTTAMHTALTAPAPTACTRRAPMSAWMVGESAQATPPTT